METANAQLVRTLYAAFARRDVALIIGNLDPDFEVVQTELLPWGGRYHGTQGALEFFATLTKHLNSHPQVEEMIEAGDSLVALGRVRGTVNSNGQTFDVRLAHVWKFRNGKALRFEAYIDTPAMLQALTDKTVSE